jgi:steroid delta-isomerase-like uncharacterized protein
MTRQEIVQLFDRRNEAWRRHDAAALAADHAEASTVTSPIFGKISGRDAILGTYRDLFAAFADWIVEAQDFLIDGDRVAEVFTAKGTHVQEFFGVPGTGRRFLIRGVIVFDFKDGKIVHEDRFYDFTGMLLQIGVLKAKPG